MCTRQWLSVRAFRSIQILLNANHAIVHDMSSKFPLVCRYSTKSAFHWTDYVICNKFNNALINKCVGPMYSSEGNQIAVPIVTYEEVKELPNHPEKLLIDVREPDELNETGIIPTAINIPLGEVNGAFNMKAALFEAKYKRSKPKFTDEVIFHCMIGRRSEKAATIASQLGYTNAKNYAGSWSEWSSKLPKN